MKTVQINAPLVPSESVLEASVRATVFTSSVM